MVPITKERLQQIEEYILQIGKQFKDEIKEMRT